MVRSGKADNGKKSTVSYIAQHWYRSFIPYKQVNADTIDRFLLE